MVCETRLDIGEIDAMMAGVRLIVISDVHGCLDLLDELIAKVEYKKGSDRLFFVGDLVDRGPDSVGCVRRVKELGAISTIGNHEDKQIRYFKHEQERKRTGKKNPMKMTGDHLRTASQLTENDIKFIATWPLWCLPNEDLAIVHAGFLPGVPFLDQEPNVCVRLRYVDTDNEFAASSPGVKPAGTKRWAEVWSGPESVICGHAAHSLADPRIDNSAPGVFVYSIDTGACFGGRLTAMVIYEDEHMKHEFVQVQAKTAYAKWHQDGDG